MDHLARVIVAALLALFGATVFASGTVSSVPGVQQWSMSYSGCPTTNLGYFAGYAPAAQAYAPFVQKKYQQDWCGAPSQTGTAPTLVYTGCTAVQAGNSCTVFYNFNGAGVTLSITRGADTASSCPANSTSVSGACVCSTGYIPNTGATACVPLGPPVCAVAKLGDTQLGPFTSQANMTLGWSSCQAVAATATTAAGGCKHVYDFYYGAESASGWYGTFRESTSGATCTPNGGGFTPDGGSGTPPPAPAPPASTPDPSAPVPTPPASSCAAGTCPGVFNGTSMCVACTGGMASAGTGTGTSNPAGAASAPSGGSGTTAGTGGGGTTPIPSGGSSLSGTSCSAGLCVTQTFIRDANGTVVGQTTTSAPQTTFCANNPGDPICVALNTGPSGVPGTGTGASGAGSGGGGGSGTSTFGGSCLAGFACTGDAVQCAMARDQLLRNCALNDASAESQAGLDAMSDGDAKHAAGTNRRGADTTVDIGVRAAAAWVNPYAASCPADRVFNLGSLATFTIPLSSMCTLLQAMGLALVAITVLGCSYLLVTKGV